LDAHNQPSASTLPTTPRKRGKEVIQASGTPSKLIAKHFSSLNLTTPSKPDVFGSDSEDEASPEERLILKIHGTRTHLSTDGILEYRLEIAPKQLVRMAESGIKGTRVPEGPDEWASEEDEDEDAKTGKGKGSPIDPETHLRLWMPACMVALVEPQLVEEYENTQALRAVKKSRSNRAATHGGKTLNQTKSKGKSKSKEDALAEMKRNTSPGRKQRPEFPTSGVSCSTQIKTASKGKSKAKVDAFSEMLKKTSPGREQRPASPTPVSRSPQIRTYGKVIEVSSDSDSDSSLPSRIALPPLMAARARATTKSIQTTTLAQPYKKAFGKILVHTPESEIIDLTQ
jgi:Holliday junction resolvase YEN1